MYIIWGVVTERVSTQLCEIAHFTFRLVSPPTIATPYNWANKRPAPKRFCGQSSSS